MPMTRDRSPSLLGAVVLLQLAATCTALDNGLGRTPPLGWSSWNYFANDINETVIMQMADAMVSTGLAKAGYEYINVDAGYLVHARDPASGKLVVNKDKFPGGIRKVANHVHALGLKLGVYTDLAAGSCGKGPGSYGHYKIDAETFAHDWQADYLKVDYCGGSVPRTPGPSLAAFAALRDALNATGRPMYYSICPHANAIESGTGLPYHGAQIYSPPPSWNASTRHGLANSLLVEYVNNFDLWYADPVPAGDGGAMHEPGGMITDVDSMVQMTKFEYSVPGSWNDADMLQMCTFGEGATRHWNSTGHPDNHGVGMTLHEYAAHLALWSVFGSPLIHSADLRTVKQRHPKCLDLMLNPEMLAVNQDAAAYPTKLLYATTNITGRSYTEVNSTAIATQAFARRLSGKSSYAVVLFNRGEAPTHMKVDFAVLGLHRSNVTVRDIILRENLPSSQGAAGYAQEVAAHSVAFLVLS